MWSLKLKIIINILQTKQPELILRLPVQQKNKLPLPYDLTKISFYISTTFKVVWHIAQVFWFCFIVINIHHFMSNVSNSYKFNLFT